MRQLARDLAFSHSVKLLELLNAKLEALLDRDHQVGHSYFLGVKNAEELHKVWRHKILPLLQEYFHGDGEKLFGVVGEAFVESQQVTCGEETRQVFRPRTKMTDDELIAGLKSLI